MPEHRTSEFITKFELARILGLRILQLEQSNHSSEHPQAVSASEILEGRNAAIIRRRLPDNTHEDRAVRDLKLTLELRRILMSKVSAVANLS